MRPAHLDRRQSRQKQTREAAVGVNVITAFWIFLPIDALNLPAKHGTAKNMSWKRDLPPRDSPPSDAPKDALKDLTGDSSGRDVPLGDPPRDLPSPRYLLLLSALLTLRDPLFSDPPPLRELRRMSR